MKIDYRIVWASLLLLVLAGCAQENRTNDVEALVSVENTILAATRTVNANVRAGIIDPGSEDAQRLRDALVRAHEAIRAAWDAWEIGNSVIAFEQKDRALEAYLAIRPLLLRYAGEVE